MFVEDTDRVEWRGLRVKQVMNVTDVEDKKPISEDNVFWVASMTKISPYENKILFVSHVFRCFSGSGICLRH